MAEKKKNKRSDKNYNKNKEINRNTTTISCVEKETTTARWTCFHKLQLHIGADEASTVGLQPTPARLTGPWRCRCDLLAIMPVAADTAVNLLPMRFTFQFKYKTVRRGRR